MSTAMTSGTTAGEGPAVAPRMTASSAVSKSVMVRQGGGKAEWSGAAGVAHR